MLDHFTLRKTEYYYFLSLYKSSIVDLERCNIISTKLHLMYVIWDEQKTENQHDQGSHYYSMHKKYLIILYQQLKYKGTQETLLKLSLLTMRFNLRILKITNYIIQISLFFAVLDRFTCKRPTVEAFNSKIISTISAKNTVIQSFELRVSNEDHPLFSFFAVSCTFARLYSR